MGVAMIFFFSQLHPHDKHTDIKFQFMWNQMSSGIVAVLTQAMAANMLTEDVPCDQFCIEKLALELLLQHSLSLSLS